MSERGQELKADDSLDSHGFSVDWRRFRDPGIALGLALGAAPFELLFAPQAALFFVVKASLPRWRETLRHIRSKGRPDAEILESLWVLFYSVSGELVAPALSLLLLEAGNSLRDMTAANMTQNDVEVIPSRLYWVERGDRRRRIHLKHLKRGDRVHLGAGDRVPADGVIRKGHAILDAIFLTGASTLTSKSPGDRVYASTLLSKGQIVLEVDVAGTETRVSSMLEGWMDKRRDDTRLSNYMEDLGNRAVLPALAGSAAVFMITGGSINKSLAPLSLDFAQGVGIAAPIPVIRHIRNSVEKTGVLIKGGHVLERLAAIDAIVFDKSGTLTERFSEIEAVESFDERYSEDHLLELALSASRYTLHPFTLAIEDFAKTRGVTARHADVLASSDSGVLAEMDGLQVAMGTIHFLKTHGIRVNAAYHRTHKSVIRDRSIRYVAVNHVVVGAISYTNPIRATAATAITQLESMGVACHLFTGDNSRAANAVAYKLGFKPSNTFSDVSADEKVLLLEKIKRQSLSVAYVGDGLNDVPALVAADVGISFMDGTDLSRECADVVMLHNNLDAIPQGIHSARNAMGLVRQNIALVISANIVTVAGGVFFNMGPLISVVINNGAIILAGLNGMRQPELRELASVHPPRSLVRNDQNLLGMDWQKRRRSGLDDLLDHPFS